ncbi:MAG: hypothetical protein ACFCU1_12915 [Sumerlaeia bacterium]
MNKFRSIALLLLASAAVAAPQTLEAQASRFIYGARDLPKGRGFHGSAVMGDYLYVFGGSSTTTPADPQGNGWREDVDLSVIKAQILQGGQLGEWENTTPLPRGFHYIEASTISLNDVVYVVGGSALPANGDYYNTAIWSKPLPDGTLMPWRESRPFGEKLAIMTAITTPGHLHIIGGLTDNDGTRSGARLPTAKVYSNNIFSDGTMGEWKEGPTLPVGLWFHSAGVVAGRAYVWGGLAGLDPTVESTSANVFSSPILGSGELGPWRAESTYLTYGMFSASSAVAGPYLISFSPRYPSAPGTPSAISSDVWWSYITPNGLQPWVREETNIPNRLYHSITPDYRRGTIYLLGGRPERAVEFTNKVSYFTLSPAARSMAENQWSALNRAHSTTVSTFDTLASSTSTGPQGADQLSYLADRRLASSASKGFYTITEARNVANSASGKKPLIIYFNADTAQPCVDQKAILDQPEFAAVANKAAFAWVNTREYPQLAQQLGVYRVPTWVFFDRNDSEVRRVSDVIPMQELGNIVDTLP